MPLCGIITPSMSMSGVFSDIHASDGSHITH